MSSDSSTLHPIERSILKALTKYNEPVKIEDLVRDTMLNIDQVRRGIERLKFNNLVDETKEIISIIEVKSKDTKLPERELVNAIKHEVKRLDQIIANNYLTEDEAKAAVGRALRNKWVHLSENKEFTINPEAADVKSLEEMLFDELKKYGSLKLDNLSEQQMKGYEELKRRPDLIITRELKNPLISITKSGRELIPILETEKAQERRLTSELITSGKWKETKFSALDVVAPAPVVYPGRRHPLIDIIEEVKEIFVGLGFSEIDGPVVQSGFWNFDALYTPQDHPAREMQDTFYISGQRQAIPATGDQKRKVAEVHKKGWGSKWDTKEAERVVLRTHTTPVTLKHLATIKPEVGRFFSVGRVFRNEKVSYKHLVEFHQVEGVATAPCASLRDLMGLQKEFYVKMGIKKVKFWPTFFPYTEPSLQSMVYNEKLEKWVELFGMGIFRPEVMEPLGVKNPVLAWGGGLERIAMLRFGLDDVRELYGNRLTWLRSVPRCQL